MKKEKRKIKKKIQKENYREILLYLFFGGMTFLISVVSYMFLLYITSFRAVVANIISWITAVIFAFVTNCKFVFVCEVKDRGKFIIRLAHFLEARVFTLFIEEIIIWLFIERMGMPDLVIKIMAQTIVIIVNYILSRLWIFKEK